MLAKLPGKVCVAVVALLVSVPSVALAQDDIDPEELYGDKSSELAEGAPAQLGVGVRLRYVFMPKAMIELFVDAASSGVGHPGFGLEIVRRKGNFDIVLGIEYESIAPDDGLFLEKGDTPGVPGENPDFTEFPDFGLLGLDVVFVWHKTIVERVDFRYGAGIGIAAVLGDVVQTDTTCSVQGDINSCVKDLNGEQVNEKSDDVPPVVPLVNVLIGTRIELAPQLTVNVEAGFRDLFYFGVGTTYLF